MHVRSVSSSYTSSIRYISLLMDFFPSSAAPFLIYRSLARSLSACLRTTTMKLNFITLGIPIANSLHWEFSFQSIANNLDACRSSTMKCLQFHLFLKMKFCADFESITVHLWRNVEDKKGGGREGGICE